MVTEARWKQWLPVDFERYLDVVVEAFGASRLMIGSDWPVCMVSGDYAAIMNIVIDYVKKFPPHTQTAILGENCSAFYGIGD
jgi:L-fuconolactonase